MRSSCNCDAAVKAVWAWCALFALNVWANPVYPGDTRIWAVPSRQLAIPNGYYISETILTLYNVSVFAGDSSRLSIYMMPDKANGFYGLPHNDISQDNILASYVLSLAEFEPTQVINGTLRVRLSLLTNTVPNSPCLNAPLTFQCYDGSSAAISPAILQLMDYLGSSPSVAFGFHSKGFSFDSISLLTICRPYAASLGTRTFLLNSGNLRPPVLNPLPQVSAEEGREVNLTLTAGDTDGDSLSFYGLNLPDGAILSSNQFTWTPSWTQAGDYHIRFVASDGKNSDYTDVQITVSNSDQPPVFSPLANQIGQVRKLITFPVTAVDANGNLVTVTPVHLPAGSIFQSNCFSWIPGTSQTGSYEVTFVASDGSLQSQLTLMIDISSASTSSGTYFVF